MSGCCADCADGALSTVTEASCSQGGKGDGVKNGSDMPALNGFGNGSRL